MNTKKITNTLTPYQRNLKAALRLQAGQSRANPAARALLLFEEARIAPRRAKVVAPRKCYTFNNVPISSTLEGK